MNRQNHANLQRSISQPAGELTQHESMHRQSHGFTLLELLVVMVIIGLLAAYVGPRYFAQLGKSEQGAAKAQIEAFAKALDTYRLDTGYFPSADLGLNALVVRPSGNVRWRGPYLQKAIPLDPWGRAYIYQASSPDSDFNVISYGKDGQVGGVDDNADISFR
ncbi:MAG: putative secretion system X protein GspG-like 3 [Comamonadaceae bacterium]|nr:MAG: putative secretion system X protein GspG-like 3 [Comamonadaceae bacterium]